MKYLRDKVYNFKTKYREGFTDSEIAELLADFPTIDLKKFNGLLTGTTCSMIDDKLITYHTDVLTALRCCVENRDMTQSEFD